MMEGSGSEAVPLNNGSGYGPKTCGSYCPKVGIVQDRLYRDDSYFPCTNCSRLECTGTGCIGKECTGTEYIGTEYTGTYCAETYSTCVISGDILHGVDLWEGVEDVKGANKKLVLKKETIFTL